MKVIYHAGRKIAGQIIAADVPTSEAMYSVPLSWRFPTNPFRWPSYLWNFFFRTHAIISHSDIASMSLTQEQTGWSAQFNKNQVLNGLDHVKHFEYIHAASETTPYRGGFYMVSD